MRRPTCVYVRACERTCVRVRAHVRTRVRSCKGVHCVCVYAYVNDCMCVLAHVRARVTLRMWVWVRARVGAHACVSSRTRGCACVYMHVWFTILHYPITIMKLMCRSLIAASPYRLQGPVYEEANVPRPS